MRQLQLIITENSFRPTPGIRHLFSNHFMKIKLSDAGVFDHRLYKGKVYY